MRYRCSPLSARHKAMCENKSAVKPKRNQKSAPLGGRCNGASFNASSSSRLKRPTVVAVAKGLFLKVCSVVHGADSIIQRVVPSHGCRQIARAASAASRMTGIIVRGVMAPDSLRKAVAPIRTSVIQRSVSASDAVGR